MNAHTKDGGPSFPVVQDPKTQTAHSGMSLRDWFAGQSLISMQTWIPWGGDGDLNSARTLHLRAQWAYQQADAMLKAREES